MFCRSLRLRELFHEDTVADTDRNNTIYNKIQERTDMSRELKNRSFHPRQDRCDKFNQHILSIKNDIINLCDKKYINHQQYITKKLVTKNLQSNQDIIIHSADTKEGK